MDQPTQKHHDVNDFVSTPIGVPLQTELKADPNDIDYSPPLPSFYGGPENREGDESRLTAPAPQ